MMIRSPIASRFRWTFKGMPEALYCRWIGKEGLTALSTNARHPLPCPQSSASAEDACPPSANVEDACPDACPPSANVEDACPLIVSPRTAVSQPKLTPT
jgi:hypothetical protein